VTAPDIEDQPDEQWHPCPDCGCQTSAMEWACWRCGAVQPDEEDDDR
jgi:hypothetical protein